MVPSSTRPHEMRCSKAPVVRWPPKQPRKRHSRSASESTSSSSSSSSSPDLSLLREALREPLVTRPPPARLPPPYRARVLARPPPLFDSLARSTLPTASLSPLPDVSTAPTNPSPQFLRPPPIVLTSSCPRRSSLETLRRAHSRSISSTDASPPSASSLLPGLPTSSSFSWWFNDSKESHRDSLLSEEDRHQPLKKKYNSTNNPVVFCHGLLGFDSVTIGPAIAPLQVAHWRGIKEVLEENGTEVLITRVPATSSYVDRAKVLEERISQVYPGKSIHLIGHSMGGLDCRYLTTHLTNRKFNVLSVTTIATPHRGSSFADHFLKTVGPERMPSVLSLLDMLPNGGGDGQAFKCLTVEHMKKFNEETPDVEGVKYFSWGAVYDPGLIDTWKWPHSVILAKEGPNDGLVSINSARWGTYLGTLQQVNHLDLVGWINTARYKWAEIMGKEIKFHPATFYLGVVDMLAREVEGQKESEVPASTQAKQQEEREEPASTQAKQQEEREQMFHSLEDAGAEVQSPEANSSPKSAASNQSSTESDGCITPTDSSLDESSPSIARSAAPKLHPTAGTTQRLHKETNEGKDEQEPLNKS